MAEDMTEWLERLVSDFEADLEKIWANANPAALLTEDFQFQAGRGFVASLNRPASKQPSSHAPPADEQESGDQVQEQGEDEDNDDEEIIQEEDAFDEPALVAFLRGLHPNILMKYTTIPAGPVQGLNAHVTPFPHQSHAAGVIEQAGESQFKGLILADPPGMGKTLSSLLAVVQAAQNGRGPAVIVAPLSCCRQWVHEINKFFDKAHVSVLLLLTEQVSPLDLFNYTVIVTSYNRVTAEFTRLEKFVTAIDDYKRNKTNLIPKRPHVTLLSGIFEANRFKGIGKYLVLDEAHIVKNTSSVSYAAVAKLRRNFDACIMLTGTPLDNTWHDSYALLSLLRGHPITSMRHMLQAFATTKYIERHTATPSGKNLGRIVQILDAVTLRRPASIVQASLPGITYEVVHFDLPAADRTASNVEFQDYVKARHASDPTPRGTDEERIRKWSSLIKAQQHASHPKLVQIMELERAAFLASHNDDEAVDIVVNDDEEQMLREWRANLRENRGWRSSRVDVVIDIFVRARFTRPDDVFLVMDESVYFLDILEIAFEKCRYPVPIFRYDGRRSPAERAIMLEKFSNATGSRIMLASRGTGGVGLNVQCANVLIRCGPWWKVSWEEQAIGRIYRPGQTRPVSVYELNARACQVDKYKKGVRNRKNRTNQLLMNAVTRFDNATPNPKNIT